MFWVELTSDAFPAAVQRAEGVCLVPLGCVERHAHHLPSVHGHDHRPRGVPPRV